MSNINLFKKNPKLRKRRRRRKPKQGRERKPHAKTKGKKRNELPG